MKLAAKTTTIIKPDTSRYVEVSHAVTPCSMVPSARVDTAESITAMTNGRYVKETDTSRWSLQGGVFMVGSNTSGRRPKDYYVLSCPVAPDGTAFMSVLDTLLPAHEENIEMWTEKWVAKSEKEQEPKL